MDYLIIMIVKHTIRFKWIVWNIKFKLLSLNFIFDLKISVVTVTVSLALQDCLQTSSSKPTLGYLCKEQIAWSKVRLRRRRLELIHTVAFQPNFCYTLSKCFVARWFCHVILNIKNFISFHHIIYWVVVYTFAFVFTTLGEDHLEGKLIDAKAMKCQRRKRKLQSRLHW